MIGNRSRCEIGVGSRVNGTKGLNNDDGRKQRYDWLNHEKYRAAGAARYLMQFLP